MRIVTWNCNGALRKKWERLATLEADLYVIQECEEPATCADEHYREWAAQHIWVGANRNKGLGVFASRAHRLTPVELPHDPLQLFLPCLVDNVPLLAIWTKQANSPNFKYIGQLWKFLQSHREFLRHPKAMAVGDFNANAIWDEWDRWWNHTDVVRELGELGLRSGYHEYFKEEQGKESRPTYFQHRHLTKPYHIDYGFFGDAWLLRDAAVGDATSWLTQSDHMPVVFELE
jgi:exonuclease III